MAKTITLKDPVTREPQYPVTTASNVYDENGNVLPSVYATKAELSDYAIKDSVEGVLLWKNGSPTASFAEQTITVSQDMSNFKYIKINYRGYSTDYNATQSVLFKVGTNVELTTTSTWHLASDNYAFRVCGRYTSTPLSGTAITFNECVKLQYSNSTTPTITMDNNRCVPIEIYGIK